jgi:ABC-2 type transport system permease protein
MSSLTGTGTLIRAALRRDRVLVPSWLAVFVAMAASSAVATVDLYPSVAERMAAADAVNNSQALVAMYGRVYDPSSIGAISMIKMGGIGAVFVAMLAVVLTVRHTRADEETGRLELVGGTVTGRNAPLAAALAVVALTNVVLALLTALTLTASGLPVEGSFAFGAAWAGVGLAFAAVTAVVAQLTTSARTATSMSATVLAVVYVLRAVGDTASPSGPRWLTWLSPIGWGQQFRPYAGNRWWVLLITLGFAVLAVAGAFALVAQRDLGTGMLPPRPGRPTAPPLLRTPLALAWRLQRAALLGWAVGFLLLGAVLGTIVSDIGGFLNSPTARDFIRALGGEKALTDAFLALELSIAGVIAAAYGIQAVLRLRAEEVELRAEPVLAAAVGRLRWAVSHVVVAVAGPFVLMLCVGVGAGFAHAARVGDPGQGGRVVAGALVQLPAAWVLVAIGLAAYGVSPRLAPVGWVALTAFLLLGEFGTLLGLSQWVMDLSPFAHTPRLPGAPFSALPLVVLTLLAAALGAAGLAALRRRDIA